MRPLHAENILKNALMTLWLCLFSSERLALSAGQLLRQRAAGVAVQRLAVRRGPIRVPTLHRPPAGSLRQHHRARYDCHVTQTHANTTLTANVLINHVLSSISRSMEWQKLTSCCSSSREPAHRGPRPDPSGGEPDRDDLHGHEQQTSRHHQVDERRQRASWWVKGSLCRREHVPPGELTAFSCQKSSVQQQETVSPQTVSCLFFQYLTNTNLSERTNLKLLTQRSRFSSCLCVLSLSLPYR